MIIAGDIGGTKTNLAQFEVQEGDYSFTNLMTFASQKYPDLKSIVQEYMEKTGKSSFTHASFAIAGPVKEGVCKATNLPWIVDAKALSHDLNISNVFLLNDLEANAYAIEVLKPENLIVLFPGSGEFLANRVVVSPGTGLGEAGLFWDGQRYRPFATEGGHCEFGPRGELQIDLCRYIYRKFGHASCERILSGPGLHNIYLFYTQEMGREEPKWLLDEFKQDDPAKVITVNALNGKSELCKDCLNLFASILGAEVSNCVLKFMALGGVFLGGGIPPKILPVLKESVFYEGFLDKGRFRELLEEVPISVILDDKASLKGSAHFCRLQLEKI